MNARNLARNCLPIALTLAGFCLVVNAAQAPNGPDVAEQPARVSARAKVSVLTSVAQAGSRLVAVGERGIVLLSDDSGKTWQQAKSVPTSVTLTGAYFPDAKIGWVVGHSGVILKTNDGGDTWLFQLNGKQAALIEKVAADASVLSSNTPTRRQRSADALVSDGADKPFLDVHFFDDQHGFVVGAYGLAFSTSDGGKTWTSMVGQIDNPGSRHLYHISVKSDAVILTGEQGLVLLSDGGTQAFKAKSLGYAGTMFGAVMPGDSLVVFGLRGNAFRSKDKGATWEKLTIGLPVTLTAGRVLRDGRVVVSDETGRVFLSADGGAHFSSLSIPKMNAATDIVEAPDGALVATTLRGPVRIESKFLQSKSTK